MALITLTTALAIIDSQYHLYSKPQKSINKATSSISKFDKFGIEKIYATKSGGREWYVNMDEPKNDPYFQNLADIQFTKQPDNSWQVDSTNGQIRMESWSPPNEKWLNVEITEYAKIISTTDDLLQMYSRGGKHTYSDPCLGSAYKARLYGDGTAAWVKEVTFPAYTSERGKVHATTNPLDGRWVGFKAVIYNVIGSDGKTYVRMESYIDDDVTDPTSGNLVIKNNWKLASVVEDKGGWATDNTDFDPRCGVLRDSILTAPGGSATQNIVAWRTDNSTWNFKYLSAREIQPPQ